MISFSLKQFQLFISAGILTCTLGTTIMIPAMAETTYHVHTHKTHYRHPMRRRIGKIVHSPITKNPAIGAGAGAVVGGVATTSVIGGAAAGAGAGLGYGLVDRSKYFKHHPLGRRTSKGAIIGTGAGLAVGAAVLPAAAVGAGIGAGVHYIKKYKASH